MKYLQYHQKWTNHYFWRTWEQQEIDYIEEHDGVLSAYEFKWSTKKISKIPQTFLKAYPDHQTEIITPENFENFVM